MSKHTLHHHPKGAIAHFTDPRTHQVIWVIPRSGEAHDIAIKRVAINHRIDEHDVVSGAESRMTLLQNAFDRFEAALQFRLQPRGNGG